MTYPLGYSPSFIVSIPSTLSFPQNTNLRSPYSLPVLLSVFTIALHGYSRAFIQLILCALLMCFPSSKSIFLFSCTSVTFFFPSHSNSHSHCCISALTSLSFSQCPRLSSPSPTCSTFPSP